VQSLPGKEKSPLWQRTKKVIPPGPINMCPSSFAQSTEFRKRSITPSGQVFLHYPEKARVVAHIPCTGLTLTLKSRFNTRTARNMQCFYAGDFTLFAAMPCGGPIRDPPSGFPGEENRGTGAAVSVRRPHKGSAGSVAGHYLTEIEGMIILFGIEFFQLRVEKGVIHRRFIDDPAFVVIAGDIDDR
jgi:hypothetical protein